MRKRISRGRALQGAMQQIKITTGKVPLTTQMIQGSSKSSWKIKRVFTFKKYWNPSNVFWKGLLDYRAEWQRKRGIQRTRCSTSCFILPNGQITKSGLGQSQEPRISFWGYVGVTGIYVPEPFFCFQMHFYFCIRSGAAKGMELLCKA